MSTRGSRRAIGTTPTSTILPPSNCLFDLDPIDVAAHSIPDIQSIECKERRPLRQRAPPPPPPHGVHGPIAATASHATAVPASASPVRKRGGGGGGNSIPTISVTANNDPDTHAELVAAFHAIQSNDPYLLQKCLKPNIENLPREQWLGQDKQKQNNIVDDSFGAEVWPAQLVSRVVCCHFVFRLLCPTIAASGWTT
jgi:hypothetical protein